MLSPLRSPTPRSLEQALRSRASNLAAVAVRPTRRAHTTPDAGDDHVCRLHQTARSFSDPVSPIATVRSKTSTPACRAAPPADVKRTQSLRLAWPPEAFSSDGSVLEANGEPPHSARASASVLLPRWRSQRASRNGPAAVAGQATVVLATCRCRQTVPTAVSAMVPPGVAAPIGCRGFGTVQRLEHRAGRSSGHARSDLRQADVVHRGADNHSPLTTVGRLLESVRPAGEASEMQPAPTRRLVYWSEITESFSCSVPSVALP